MFSNYFDKIGTLLNAKSDKLDIFMTGPYQIWEYGSAGYMEDLQPYIDNDKRTDPNFDPDDFFQSILDSARWDGVVVIKDREAVLFRPANGL